MTLDELFVMAEHMIAQAERYAARGQDRWFASYYFAGVVYTSAIETRLEDGE